MAQSSSQSLPVGNVITIAFQLYKNRFQPYFLLALKAYCWLLVPVYGWAKFCATSALISRLVYGELVNQPETIKDVTRYVNSKLWQFLAASTLLSCITLGVYIVLGIPLSQIVAIVVGFLVVRAFFFQVAYAQMLFIICIFSGIVFVFGSFLILIRFFVFELPLAVEDNMDSTSAIGRSWELTKGFVGRILLIYFVAFLITIPIPLVVLVQVISSIFQGVLISPTDQNPSFTLLFIILTLGLSFLSGAIQLPFWQAIKAVVYYDLRTCKEGLGLNLRDRNV